MDDNEVSERTYFMNLIHWIKLDSIRFFSEFKIRKKRTNKAEKFTANSGESSPTITFFSFSAFCLFCCFQIDANQIDLVRHTDQVL